MIGLSEGSAANITIGENTTGGINGAINDPSVNPGDTVFLEPGTYNKTNQDTNITINKNVKIQGNGPPDKVIIDSRKLSRIFIIDNNLNVTFINITFINGNTTGNGGAIHNQYADTMMTVINCTFTGNNADNGGAIYNTGGASFTVTNSTFTNNNAKFDGGAIYNNGDHNFTVTNSTLTDNSAGGNGSAIYNNNGNVSIKNVIIDGDSSGNAIYNGGNGSVTTSNVTGTALINSGSTVVTPAGTVGKKTTISGVAVDGNGNRLANTRLTVTVNGVVRTVITNGVGVWSFVITPNVAGKLNVVVTWSGNSTHNGFTTRAVWGVAKVNRVDLAIVKVVKVANKKNKNKNKKVVTYRMTIQNKGKLKSKVTNLKVWQLNKKGKKIKAKKFKVKAIAAGKKITLTFKYKPNKKISRDRKVHFMVNPKKTMNEISYKNNLKRIKI